MRTVAINQSNYIPWKGYFDLINDVDVFMFYDDVQFTVRDWRNRNKIKTPQGPIWLTIPVGGNRDRLICEVEIADSSWQAKHWRTISQFYRKAPFFKRYEAMLHEFYVERTWRRLSDLNQHLIRIISQEHLGVKAEFIHSSDYVVSTKKQDRILDLLKAVGADAYVSGPSGKAYIDPERFLQEGIELIWKDYLGYPEYSQFYPPFEHAVTVLDLLLHTGPDAPYYIWGWREGAHQTPHLESQVSG